MRGVQPLDDAVPERSVDKQSVDEEDGVATAGGIGVMHRDLALRKRDGVLHGGGSID